MRRLVIAILLAGCDAAPTPPPCEGDVLFGRPNDKTGLTEAQCQPSCTCLGEPFEAPDHGDAEIEAVLAWQLIEPMPELTEDPYALPAPAEPPPDTVCAVVADPPADRRYHLQSFASEAAARAAGATPTHLGACGLCSPLADLAVYMRHTDLTAPVRTCGLESNDDAELVACLEALGFTRPCAQIWAYNTVHTRDACIIPCLAALNEPYHLPDGTLNECLLCDERESGPVFKAVAGRTRRNTGVASSMCRPCSEVRPLVHEY